MTAARNLEPTTHPDPARPRLIPSPTPRASSDSPQRNYVAEMRSVIDSETASGDYSSPLVAEHIVKKLRVTDPDLLDGWLHAQAVQFVRHMINLRDCSARTHARTAARRSAFADSAALHAAGDERAMVGWLDVVHVLEDGGRKRIAEMTAAELGFVADAYDARANENALHAAFLRAVAKRVGKRKVSDVFTEQKLTTLWQSIAGG
jgi:hypothetical protein